MGANTIFAAKALPGGTAYCPDVNPVENGAASPLISTVGCKTPAPVFLIDSVMVLLRLTATAPNLSAGGTDSIPAAPVPDSVTTEGDRPWSRYW